MTCGWGYDKFEVEDGEYRWRGMSDMDVGD